MDYKELNKLWRQLKKRLRKAKTHLDLTNLGAMVTDPEDELSLETKECLRKGLETDEIKLLFDEFIAECDRVRGLLAEEQVSD